MILHEIHGGMAVLHLLPEDCRTLARLLDSLPDHGGPDQVELVDTLVALFGALAVATRAQQFLYPKDEARVTLEAVIGKAPAPEVPQ